MEELGESSEHQKDLQLIISEIDRLTETTDGLLQYSRPADAETTVASAERVIDRLLKILRYLARQHGVSVVTDFQAHDCLVCGSEATISEIFFNLIKNAIEAAALASEAPQVVIRTRADHSGVTVSVCDNGPGIGREIHDQLFEPFVTGKQEGTGLGLYLVSARVRESGGAIDFSSQPGDGTEFRIRMPAEQPDRVSS